MAVGLWGLRLLRAAPGGGAGRKFIATSTASHLSPTELIEMQNDLFNKEKKRQLSLTPRTEKIEVKHVGKTDPGTLFVMNKNISTPYSCAMHLGEWYCRKSILALVDGQPWDMYKPLTKSCDIKFLTFKDRDPGEVNKAYWRSCAMMMGCVIERAFKDEYVVSLVRAPEVPVIAGAFCYDVVLDKRLDEWMPSKENLRSFTKDARALIYKDLPFETLEVDAKVALEIFQHNKYKIDYIEEKASQNPERVVKLHRFGDFIDVSEGPLIPRTSICFQYEVSAVHNLQATQSSLVRRFQGLSLPVHLRAHFTVWDKLLERSRKMGQKMKATANMMPQGPGPPKILHLSYCFISLLLSLSALPLEPRWQTANSWRLLARPSLSAPLPPRVVSSLSILSQSAHHTALERLGLECFSKILTNIHIPGELV